MNSPTKIKRNITKQMSNLKLMDAEIDKQQKTINQAEIQKKLEQRLRKMVDKARKSQVGMEKLANYAGKYNKGDDVSDMLSEKGSAMN